MNNNNFSQDEKDMVLNELGQFTIDTSDHMNGKLSKINYDIKCDKIIDLIRKIQKCNNIQPRYKNNFDEFCKGC